jgi:hypothetical protein
MIEHRFTWVPGDVTTTGRRRVTDFTFEQYQEAFAQWAEAGFPETGITLDSGKLITPSEIVGWEGIVKYATMPVTPDIAESLTAFVQERHPAEGLRDLDLTDVQFGTALTIVRSTFPTAITEMSR